MIMFTPRRGPKGEDGNRLPRLYSEPYAQHLVQQIRKDAGLPVTFTLEACRHGGMTELGDAELTEQEVMTLSTHATPQASRLYVKRTERQEEPAAVKRRNFIERRTKRG
jgi:IS5 family transposase